MSSKKDVERKEREKKTISKSPDDQISPDSTPEVSLKQQREEQQQSVNRALEQTRDNIRKSADEAKNQIPRYTQAVNDYHEQTIKAAREKLLSFFYTPVLSFLLTRLKCCCC